MFKLESSCKLESSLVGQSEKQLSDLWLRSNGGELNWVVRNLVGTCIKYNG